MRAVDIIPDIRRGAGCLIRAKDTGKILLIQRSAYVDHPRTWALPGGHAEINEDYLTAALREAAEEIGYDLSDCPHHLIYETRTDWPFSVYKTYAVLVDKQFDPQLDWESENHLWSSLGELPTPLHWGVEAMLNNDQAAERLHGWLTSLG